MSDLRKQLHAVKPQAVWFCPHQMWDSEKLDMVRSGFRVIDHTAATAAVAARVVYGKMAVKTKEDMIRSRFGVSIQTCSPPQYADFEIRSVDRIHVLMPPKTCSDAIEKQCMPGLAVPRLVAGYKQLIVSH